jgi:anti-anti-sigma factor
MTTELDVSVRLIEPAAGLGRSLTIAIHGELDIETAPRFAARFDDPFYGAPSNIVIDVSELAFIDMAGLRALAALCAQARRQLIHVQLAEVPRQMRGLMNVIGDAWVSPAIDPLAEVAADTGA